MLKVLRLLALFLLLPSLAFAQSTANQTLNTIPSANTTFLSDLQNFLKFEDPARFQRMLSGFVVSGGTHGTGASLTQTPTALVAFPGGQYTTESGAITYTNNKTCYVTADALITGNTANFVRVAGTHYSVDCTSSSKPALPTNYIWLMQVTTSGGSVTAVLDIRSRVPFAQAMLQSELPAAGLPGRLAFVTDASGGTYFWDNGTSWTSFTPPPAASLVLANWVTNGDFEVWSSSAPAQWTLTGSGAAAARNTSGGQFKISASSAQLTSGGGAVAQLTQDIDTLTGIAPAISAGPAARWGSKTVTLGVWVRAVAASVARVGINDGVNGTFYSAYHTGSSNFVFLTVTATLAATPTRIRIVLEAASGVNVAQFDGVTFGEGQTVTDFIPSIYDPVAFAKPGDQGRMSFVSSTQIKFCPYNGNAVTINAINYPIPSGCVTAANTSIFIDGTGGSNLGATTTYFVYLFNNSGTLTVDFSTTGHSTDSTLGNIGTEIKTGVASRSLIGMVRTNGSSQFEDDNSLRGVISWFNRRSIGLVNGFTADRTTTSTTYVEINTEIRSNFLTWADEAVVVAAQGPVATDTVTAVASTSIGFDGTTAEDTMNRWIQLSNSGGSFGIGIWKTGLAEGFHFATLLGSETGGGTATWRGGSVGALRSSLSVGIRG